MTIATAILAGMRPRQWSKNVFVLAPLLFALRLHDQAAVLASLVALVLFCLVAGPVYLLNDIADRVADRAHPQKRHRPIASGRLPVKVARFVAWATALAAIGGGLLLRPALGAVLAGFFALNLAYTFKLKQVPVIDVLSIATGFILRVVGGALAIPVPISNWILLCTLLLSLYLGLGKRIHEILLLGAEKVRARPVLARYPIRLTRIVFRLVGVAAMLSFALYTLSPRARLNFGTTHLVWTVPLVALGLWRYASLATDTRRTRPPTESLLSDPVVLAAGLLWGAAAMMILYWPEVLA